MMWWPVLSVRLQRVKPLERQGIVFYLIFNSILLRSINIWEKKQFTVDEKLFWSKINHDLDWGSFEVLFCFLVVLLTFDFVGSAWSFGCFIPATTANDLRLRRIFYPIFYLLHLFSYLNSWERASISLFNVQC